MRISEADPTEDDLLLKGSEERGEAVAALPFPSLPECRQGRTFLLSPQCSALCPAAGSRGVPQLQRGSLGLWKPHSEEHAMSSCVQGLVGWKREVEGRGKSGKFTE